MGNRRALFDIGVTGPLAGLVPTMIFCVVGLYWSRYIVVPQDVQSIGFGAPPLFQFLADLILGPPPPGQTLQLHATAFAGWVGMFITALNLVPIGQLDGGHVLYALLRRRAHVVANLLLLGATMAVVLFFDQYHMWLLMILLLLFIGPNHPPTSDDEMPLGWGRTLIGWATLAFLFVGFTPTPIIVS
jgi:membrane-associated protease RseP (regulator of RpoE activity)